MKQRFSSLDVKVIAHELSTTLVSLRLSNVYDLDSKILLLKFAKPGNKQQLLIESGFRCHLTDFVRTTAAAPSIFVQKLRKTLKTRRVTAVSQVGTDRILEFQFSDDRYRLYFEFFAGGNIILTDNELTILTLMRYVSEGEGQEPQRPGMTYSLENRQNYSGVPPLTKERLKDALQTIVDRSAASKNNDNKKIKKKPGAELRKGLATTIKELPPILIDHAMKVTGFDPTAQPVEVLNNEASLDHLLRALEEGRRVVEDVTRPESCRGYIIAKRKPNAEKPEDAETTVSEQSQDLRSQRKNLLYEDFHPFLPLQFAEDPAYTSLTFDNYNKMVDEFFSSIEGQKLESRLAEREAMAENKLAAAKADQAKRIEGLQATQQLNIRKAEAIEANVERVQEAMDAVNGLIQQGMDWEDIGKLIDRQRRLNNPVASIIIPPLKLHENTITLLLGVAEEEEEDEEFDDVSDTESTVSDSGYDGSMASKQRESRLAIEVDLGLSPYGNAREYYDEKKSAAVKEEKTKQHAEFALKQQEQRIAADLKKGLKREKPVLQPVRKQMWFEKFIWFISTDGYLVLGGKDAAQNEMLYRRYLRKGDIYVHADLHGAASVIIKNNPSTPDAPIPPSTLSQAGNLAVCSSSAWDQKAAMSAWWVTADQVSKSAPTGEFLRTGSFMIRGTKNFLPAAQLLLGFALTFKVSDESRGHHVKHRLYDGPPNPPTTSETSAAARSNEDAEAKEESEDGHMASDDDSAVDVEEGAETRANPLQPTEHADEDEDEAAEAQDSAPAEQMDDLSLAEDARASRKADDGKERAPASQSDNEDGSDGEEGATYAPEASSSRDEGGQKQPNKQTNQPKKKNQPPKRGQRGKAKKIAAKYKNQDDDDRAAIEELIGSAAGRKKAEAEAKAKEERKAQEEAVRERRRAQHEREQREMAEHEEVRRMMLEEGIETLDPDEVANLSPLDSLVGTPHPGDEILEVIAVCAPYAALGRCKYKVKLQPGSQKKGKAVKEILESWKAVSTRKNVVDESAQDKEKMWPREVELLKAIKHEDVINVVPVKNLRIMGTGGASGAAAKGKGGAKGGAKGGGKGKKK
ncbi:hypothetical protein F4780DRAFT_745484 [Xylariomycetidae sp. FL0641]|nr:hypothetical protein F4780DRAFT_745484 [Xylariomycetidae sp. FL0641]